MNITNLVIEYKKTKNSKTLETIFKELDSFLWGKAKQTFYKRTFQFRGMFFKLRDTHLVELNDVYQELCIKLLAIINNYDPHLPFDNYLYTSLWKWRPIFINQEFLNQLHTTSSIKYDDEGHEVDVLHNIPVEPEIESKVDICALFSNLSEQEKKVIKLVSENLDIKQSELAAAIGVEQPRVSKIIAELKEKLIY